MSLRRSRSLPIILAIVMIVLLVVLTVGFVLLCVFGALHNVRWAAIHWTLLTIGSTFSGLLLTGVVMYLILSIKAINLSRRQSNFIDSVTHELKSPIASMKLCLQTLGRHQVSQEQQADFFHFMIEDLERLDRLINQLLDAAKVEEGAADSDVEDVPLDSLLRECTETVCLRYRVGPQALDVQLQPCTVPGRRVDLDIIFRNLIENAVKYAAAEPWVGVRLRPGPEGFVTVEIADNGRGIPYKLRRKIFGRFERLGLELERDKPGTGLGLYIVRTTLRRLHGRIRVRDRDRGPGTVFEVQLPGRAGGNGEQ
jgi:two-component system, OmpR family, phosphate regulon sensor histidine kinase PhoR